MFFAGQAALGAFQFRNQLVIRRKTMRGIGRYHAMKNARRHG